MNCPFCAHNEDKVIDSRESREGDVIRRRRECLKCMRRFTTYERIEEVLNGLLKACEKRPVPMSKLAEIVDEVETLISERAEREVSTTEIGELLMQRLAVLDKVAYVRFASVYRDFQDAEAFLNELTDLIRQKRG